MFLTHTDLVRVRSMSNIVQFVALLQCYNESSCTKVHSKAEDSHTFQQSNPHQTRPHLSNCPKHLKQPSNTNLDNFENFEKNCSKDGTCGCCRLCQFLCRATRYRPLQRRSPRNTMQHVNVCYLYIDFIVNVEVTLPFSNVASLFDIHTPWAGFLTQTYRITRTTPKESMYILALWRIEIWKTVLITQTFAMSLWSHGLSEE